VTDRQDRQTSFDRKDRAYAWRRAGKIIIIVLGIKRVKIHGYTRTAPLIQRVVCIASGD